MSRFFIFLGIITLLVLVVDLYAFQGIRQLSQSLDPAWRKVARWAFWLPTIGTVVLFGVLIAGMPQFLENRNYGFFFFVTGFAFLFFIPKLVFVVFHFADDITHLARLAVDRFSRPPDSDPSERMTRVQFFNQLGLGVSAVVMGTVLYGLTRGKFAFRVEEAKLRFASLPPAFQGLRIVQISDAHLGSFLENFKDVEEGFRIIQDLQPDLIVFTGDLVNNFAYEAEPWIPYFSALTARYGKYSILGNHDYADYVYDSDNPEQSDLRRINLERLKQVHAEMGFRLLLNEHEAIEAGEERIHIIGIENWGRGRFSKYGDLAKAMEGLPDGGFRLLLSHDPTHWEDQVMGKQDIQVTFSGHTHGAQFGLESPMLNIKVSPSPYFGYQRWAGLYQEGEQYLYVNRGFGFLGFPGRVGMPPEITMVTLERA